MKDMEQLIADHPFFSEMKEDYLKLLVEGAKEMEFSAGEILFREGEPANQFYLLLSGRVVLETHEPMDGTYAVEELGEGNVLGWSWLFQPFVWHLQARAIEPTRTIVLSGAHLLIAAERDHQFGYELMKRIAQIVVRRLRAVRKRMLAGERERAKPAPETPTPP